MSYETDAQAASRLSEALQELPDNWVMCRDMRHAWVVEEDFHVTEQKGSKIVEVRRILACMRCGTTRHEKYVPSSRFGLEKISSAYHYPEHYQIHGVPRGVKPQWLIQGEQYRRTMARLVETTKG